MDPKVKDFLELRRQKEQEEKEQILIRLGLYYEEREYSDKLSNEYPKWDSDKKQYVKIRKIACKVTDEEFAEIRKYDKLYYDSEREEESNRVERFLIGLGSIIVLLGIVVGIIIGLKSPAEGVIFGVSSAISGSILMVLGRISVKLSNIEDSIDLIRNSNHFRN